MRKRSISYFADTWFWYVLYALPVLCYLFFYLAHGADCVPFATFMSDNLGFVFDSQNIVFTTIQDLFGSAGVLPLFSSDSTALSLIVTWFVTVFLVHLAIDFILFIPWFAHRFLGECYMGE